MFRRSSNRSLTLDRGLALQDRMTFRISLPTDENGLTGRECPNKECEGYFKIKFGTGLKESDLPCHCPYCGHKGAQDTFYTRDQIKYAKSIVTNQVLDALMSELKKTEFSVNGPFGLRLSGRWKAGSRAPIRRYQEKSLETTVVCSNCTLIYAIFGVFGFCPDCGNRNSLEMLAANLDIAGRQLELTMQTNDAALKRHAVENALEDGVAAFDAFGRELMIAFQNVATHPTKTTKATFQNLDVADDTVDLCFGFRLSGLVSNSDWVLLKRGFQKRHLLAHRLGVVDEKYRLATGDTSVKVGRRVQVTENEVGQLLKTIGSLGEKFRSSLLDLPLTNPKGGSS